jgi:nicotinate phosphoribosyltransferase
MVKSHARNAYVMYRVFMRNGGIVCGADWAVDYITSHAPSAKVTAMHDGDNYIALDTLMTIEGYARELLPLETTYLGMLTLMGHATSMKNLVQMVHAHNPNIQVMDMSARHNLPMINDYISYAAMIGGAVGTSTEVGTEFTNEIMGTLYEALGTLPHAASAIFKDLNTNELPSIVAAQKFRATFPNKSLTVLVDFEGKEKQVIKRSCELFGKNLYAIRLDTHGGRVHEGGHTELDECDYDFSMRKVRDVLYNPIDKSTLSINKEVSIYQAKKWLVGKGVTVEEVCNARKWLDENGCQHTKIVVSSGFDFYKTQFFLDCQAPIDMVGTGSWLDYSYHATSDIVGVYDITTNTWSSASKVGREFDVNVFNSINLDLKEENKQ